MNILVVSNSNWNLFNFRYDFLASLSKEHKVYVLLSRKDKYYRLGNNITELFIDGLDRNSIKPIQISRYLAQTRKLIKKHNIEIIYSFTFYMSVLSCLSAISYFKLKVKLYSIITGFGALYTSRKIFSLIIFHIGLIILNLSKKVFVQNATDRRYVSKYIPQSKLLLLPGSGVDMEKFSALPTPFEDVIRFCYVGRLLKSKGLNIILEAFYKFQLEFDAELMIIGDYDSNDKSFQLTNLPENVKLVGWSDDASFYYAKCHASILMSDREGLSKSLLESLSCQTPIIAHGAPGVVDIFESSINTIGINVEERNSKSLFRAMTSFAAFSEKEYLEICLNARKHVSNNYASLIVCRVLTEAIA